MGRHDKLHDGNGNNRFVARSQKIAKNAKSELEVKRKEIQRTEKIQPVKFHHKSKKKHY